MLYLTRPAAADTCTWCDADNLVPPSADDYTCPDCGQVNVRFTD